jgi:hypothetical protein
VGEALLKVLILHRLFQPGVFLCGIEEKLLEKEFGDRQREFFGGKGKGSW